MTAGYILFRAKPYGLAVVSVGVALVVRLLLAPVLGENLPYSFFYVAVIFTAWRAGTRETLVATLLGLLAAAWFIVPPRHSLAIRVAHGWWGAALYLFVCLAILWFMKSERAARLRSLGDAVEVRKHREEFQRLQRNLESTQSTHLLLANLVQIAPDAMFCLTDQVRIATWNPAAEKLFGFSAEEAIGQSLALIMPAGSQEAKERALHTISRGEPLSHWEAELINKRGSRIPVSLTISPVKDSAENLIGASVIALKRAEAPIASLG